jgi:hypothetical protein
MKNASIIGLIFGVFLFQGCATVTTGMDQTLTVETTPPGAVCTLKRDGETIGAVNPTPGSLEIQKDKDEVLITCELADHLTATNTLDSVFQGATLGNIILGGVVGVVVDAGSGAMNKYPSSVMIRMQPAMFGSLQERDKYFDAIVEEIMARSDAAADTRNYNCSTSTCKKNLERLNKETEAELAEIEMQRNKASYRDGSVFFQGPEQGSLIIN